MRTLSPIKGAFALVALLAVSLVSPFSYLPNPLGLYDLLVGYIYTPDSVFINRFATLVDDPARTLTPKLDRLIGKTGLDPLDPNHPLVAYRIRRVVGHLGTTLGIGERIGEAEVDFDYLGGTSRTYEIPVFERCMTASWCPTGLDWLTAVHTQLPALPFPTGDASIRLGTPTRLALTPDTQRLGASDVQAWTLSLPDPGEDLRWAPNGSSFLARASPAGVLAQNASLVRPLWLVELDGSPPRRVADEPQSYAWGSDGQQVVFLRLLRSDRPLPPRFQVVAVDLATGQPRDLAETDRSRVSVAGNAVYFLRKGVLWRGALDGQPPERLGPLTGERPALWVPDALAISPDGQRVVYRCGSDLCLSDVSGTNATRLSLGYTPPDELPSPTAFTTTPPTTPSPAPTALPFDRRSPASARLASLELGWSHDGQHVAVAAGATSELSPELWIVARDGKVAQHLTIGPDGTTRQPRWTKDDRFIVLNTFPRGGRRIVAVATASGKTLDLSRPRWDAFASLAPDGRTLLLWNGRGGFWTAPLAMDRI